MSLTHNDVEARERYRKSLSRAQLADLLGLISGANTDLVKFDEVANRLKARQRIEMGTQSVPLNKIVGSVGRYKDFNREFLPRLAVNKERWTKIDSAMHSLTGLPPVELYKLGDVYFVRDGNHRVSVARANGLPQIEAYVTEYTTDVPLTVDDFDRDNWIIKVECNEFMEKTHLDELRPDLDLRLTEPGRYRILLRHIEVHRYLRNLDLERSGDPHRLNWQEAVVSWYDNVYMPMVRVIRDRGLMDQFPERTEADLYLWIAHHREDISRTYELAPLSPEAAVSTFAEVYSDRPLARTLKGLRLGLHRTFVADERPLGMSDEEFQQYRARHQAGEISLGEAEAQSDSEAGAGELDERGQVGEQYDEVFAGDGRPPARGTAS